MASQADNSNWLIENLKTVFWALLIAGIFRTLFFQPFWIPSGSMKDTLLIGDFLFVNKMAYGYSRHSCPFDMCPIDGRILGDEPERGDIVVFRHPTNGTDFIKRVIGLPGDRIQLQDGVVLINDQPVPQVSAGLFRETFDRQGPLGSLPACANFGVGLGGECVKEKSIETLPEGKSYAVLNVRPGPLDNTPVFTVPEEHFFFVGDNRDNSSDSRIAQPNGLGFVPFENLIGRADRVMFSSAGRSLFFVWTWRSDRFFKALN